MGATDLGEGPRLPFNRRNMSQYVDIRVVRGQADRAARILEPNVHMINWMPPASGAETEITVTGLSEERTVEMLTTCGISVLASRTRT